MWLRGGETLGFKRLSMWLRRGGDTGFKKIFTGNKTGPIFLSIRPPPGLLPVLGPLERYMTPTLDSALLISSRVGADLGQTSDRLKSHKPPKGPVSL